MTIDTSYLAGKPVYQGGSPQPTTGTVDPTGYVQRSLDNTSTSRSGLASAMLSRLQSFAPQQPTPTLAAPAGVVAPVRNAAGQYFNSPTPPSSGFLANEPSNTSPFPVSTGHIGTAPTAPNFPTGPGGLVGSAPTAPTFPDKFPGIPDAPHPPLAGHPFPPPGPTVGGTGFPPSKFPGIPDAPQPPVVGHTPNPVTGPGGEAAPYTGQPVGVTVVWPDGHTEVEYYTPKTVGEYRALAARQFRYMVTADMSNLMQSPQVQEGLDALKSSELTNRDSLTQALENRLSQITQGEAQTQQQVPQELASNRANFGGRGMLFSTGFANSEQNMLDAVARRMANFEQQGNDARVGNSEQLQRFLDSLNQKRVGLEGQQAQFDTKQLQDSNIKQAIEKQLGLIEGKNVHPGAKMPKPVVAKKPAPKPPAKKVAHPPAHKPAHPPAHKATHPAKKAPKSKNPVHKGGK